ncbi:beta family protein [Pectobacterium brasiliense]|uniref:beta family protein n=1 Tax=Pectobacterium brasiliense TaxID=180957 RepID=UPI004044209E
MLIDNYSYIPVLSLKPAEMAALEELPSKDKSLILPLISLKKWANSKTFIKSIDRIEKAFGKNYWIADIDKEYLSLARHRLTIGDDCVSSEFVTLADPSDGYRNWVDFMSGHENIIPSIQFSDISQLDQQLDRLLLINKPLVARFELTGDNSITLPHFTNAIRTLAKRQFDHGILIILDYGDFDRLNLIEYYKYSNLVSQIHSLLPNAYFCVSGTSFPYSFAGSYRGEIPIYERQIYTKVVSECNDIKLIYSDRGSTRALGNQGGSGTPPPRIDYPLKNDWRFIRKELDPDLTEKEELYQEAAIEMMKSDYWDNGLRLWGTQMIEKTSLGDPYGITSANRATAVRINIHLYQQLHYLDAISLLDTDEDWVD